MKKWTRFGSAILVAGVALILTASDTVIPILKASQRCYLTAEFYNTSRRVTGSLDQECGKWYLPIQLEHSPPWGNWGVNSRYGRRRDAFQWAGWKRIPGTRWSQWSACTKGRFAPPNSEYYNDRGGWTQKAAPDRDYWHATHRRYMRPGRSCDSQFGNVYVYRDVYMKLYELDAGGFPFGGDDFVTRLRFGNVSVPISCDGDWHCTGVSPWKSSIPNSNGSARLRIDIRTTSKG